MTPCYESAKNFVDQMILRVGYSVLLFVVDIECDRGIKRAYRVANEDVAIE